MKCPTWPTRPVGHLQDLQEPLPWTCLLLSKFLSIYELSVRIGSLPPVSAVFLFPRVSCSSLYLSCVQGVASGKPHPTCCFLLPSDQRTCAQLPHQLHLVSTVQGLWLFAPSSSERPSTHRHIVFMTVVVKYYSMLCSAGAYSCVPVFLPRPVWSLFALACMKPLPLPATPTLFGLGHLLLPY